MLGQHKARDISWQSHNRWLIKHSSPFEDSFSADPLSCLQPAYGMTEICVPFFAQPGDTLEQATVTVGSVASHFEVSV
jgi:hypothetical protein